MPQDTNYPYSEETYKIIGCCMEVHNELGCGFLEAVYHEALEQVFLDNNIPYVKEKPLDITFRGKILNKKYTSDFICYDSIILELKATDGFIEKDMAQVLNYLKATKIKLGILVNFGTTKLQYKRIIL